ncbi:MAG: JAB domain-containing protein [Alphaproteobacteria bacterium]|nr:JAB domain-containing protein [Alphaproteobacteria bacterium]
MDPYININEIEKFLKNIIKIKNKEKIDYILQQTDYIEDIFFKNRKEIRKILTKKQNEKIDTFECLIIEFQKLMFLKEKNIYNKYFFNYLIKKYYNIDYEYALIILLKNKKFFYEKIHSIGDINSANIYSREIINLIFEKKANGFILIHNHPSGDYTPSKSDIAITNNLFTISSYLSLNFFDSLIIGKTNVYSILQKKVLDIYYD